MNCLSSSSKIIVKMHIKVRRVVKVFTTSFSGPFLHRNTTTTKTKKKMSEAQDLITLKASFQNDIRRRKVSKKELTFKKLCELLREMFLFSLPDVFEVSYKDAEGDIIHVASDIEVEEAIRQTSPTTTTTTTVVRLFLSSPSCPLSSPSQASAEQPPNQPITPSLLSSLLSSLPPPSPSPPSPDDDFLSSLVDETLSETFTTPSSSSPSPSSPPSSEALVGLLNQTLNNPSFTENTLPQLLNNPEIAKMIPTLLESPYIQQSLQGAFRDPQLINASLPVLLNSLDSFLPLVVDGVFDAPPPSSSSSPLPENVD